MNPCESQMIDWDSEPIEQFWDWLKSKALQFESLQPTPFKKVWRSWKSPSFTKKEKHGTIEKIENLSKKEIF